MSNTPNYQGVFLRGYGSQYSYHYETVLHSSGTLGGLQGDAMRNITGRSSGFFGQGIGGQGAFTGSYFYTSFFSNHSNGSYIANEQHGVHYIDFNSANVTPVAQENRPINKAVRYLIKAS